MVTTKSLNFEEDVRVFYTGDLHGHYSLLMDALEEVGFDKSKDVLICTGDLIDRGKENVKCLELMKEPWFHSVKGNHEDMAYKALVDSDLKLWIYNGGGWYLDYVGTDDMSYVTGLLLETNNLPHIIEVSHKGKKTVVCHADYPSNTYPYKEPNLEKLLWNRDRFYDDREKDIPVGIKGADAFVFGHTPQERHIKHDNLHYIDTGLFIGGMPIMLQF